MEINQAYRASILSMGQYLGSSEEDTMKKAAHHHSEDLSQHTSITKLVENFGGDLLAKKEVIK